MEHASPISLHYCPQREVQDTTGRHSVRRSQGGRTSLWITLFYPDRVNPVHSNSLQPVLNPIAQPVQSKERNCKKKTDRKKEERKRI
jgi:hypothetical protein